jgi:hypothetical protein
MTLQIHNTFGERHVHILEVGQNEEKPDAKYVLRFRLTSILHDFRIASTTNGLSHALFMCHRLMTVSAHTPSPFARHSATAILT